MLTREPGFAGLVVLTLALGIGANTAIFSVVNSVLLRPLAYREPERLVNVAEVVPKVARQYPLLPVNLAHYFDWKKRSTSFESLALMNWTSLNLTGAGEPMAARGLRISANTFDVLGAPLALGRPFTEAEERKDRDRVVILSNPLWTQRFHADPSVVGHTIQLDGKPYVVVGVAAEGWRSPMPSGLGSSMAAAATVQLFTPLGYTDDDLKDRFGDFNWTVIGRLRPGVTPEKALSEVNVIQAGITNSIPEKIELRAAIQPLRDILVADSRRGLIVVMCAVAAVLLILCVNLANLWFVRAAGLSRESAIRVALGASRATLVRQTLVESLTLALTGGLLGVVFAEVALKVLLSFAPAGFPRLGEVRLDGDALLFAVAVSVACGVLCAILPAIRTARQDPQESLKSASHANTEGVRGVWVRKTLVAAEVGLSTVLLIVAGLLIRSFDRLMSVDRGFDVERVLAADVALPSEKYAKRDQRSEFYRRLLDQARAMPGVTSAALVSALPLQGETWVDIVGNEHDTREMFARPTVNVRFISSEYFKTLGAPLRAGRAFEDMDRGRTVAIISKSVADRLFPGQDAVGRKILHNETVTQVVGVTSDFRSTSLDKDPVNMLYIPYWQRPRLSASLLVRSAIDPKAMSGSVREAVWSLDPEVPVPETRTLVQIMNKSVAERRFNMSLVLAFALSALALASFGVYGVLAYTVARRRSEIGIRMALGADAGSVRSLVLRQGMQPVAIGLAVGVAGALAAGRLLSSMLFRVSANDPLTVAAVAAALCAVALAACAVPARRATRVNPIAALRCE